MRDGPTGRAAAAESTPADPTSSASDASPATGTPTPRADPDRGPAPVSSADEPFLRVTEIFHSLQGESTWSGVPCTFVRLTGCPLRCVWCDTEYAFHGGARMTLDAIVEEVRGMNPAARQEGGAPDAPRPPPPPPPGWEVGAGADMAEPADPGAPVVEITGGEPLVHPNAFALAERLLEEGFTVLVETSGAVDVAPLDPRVHVIMDLKCPGSGESGKNRWENLEHLDARDEVKFVVKDRADWSWAEAAIRERGLDRRIREGSLRALLVSPVWGEVDLEELAGWVLESGLPVRVQTQLHKLVWGPDTKGV